MHSASATDPEGLFETVRDLLLAGRDPQDIVEWLEAQGLRAAMALALVRSLA